MSEPFNDLDEVPSSASWENVPETGRAERIEQAMTVRDAVREVEGGAGPVTAAQAKVNAIASLSASAYAKASELRLDPEEIKALQADFPDDAFKPGAAGKENLIYIEHAFLRDRLNQVIGPGQWAIVPRSRWAEDYKTANGKQASRVYVEAFLMVRGCFVAEAIGEMSYFHNNDSQNYGDAVEGAKTAALRRCVKEFGVGLQAWKKDWCEGWWRRKRGQDQPGSTPERRQQPPRASEPSKPASAPSQAKTEAPGPVCATNSMRARLLELLADPETQEQAWGFFCKVGALLETEHMPDLPLKFVPISVEQKDALMRAIADFARGDEARMPYPSNPVALEKKATETTRAQMLNAIIQADYWKAEPWAEVIVPVPRKGQKRDEYLRNPDTIGSLYEARHGTDDLAQEARQRLWGFVNNYEPKGWVKRDGTQMPPSEADKKFREALGQFRVWFEKTHPNEKL